jgi:hypothetical protein
MSGCRVGHRWGFAERVRPMLSRIARGARRHPTQGEPTRPAGSAHLSRFSEMPA